MTSLDKSMQSYYLRKQYTMEEVKELFSLFHGVLLARTGADCIDLSSEVDAVLHTAAKL